MATHEGATPRGASHALAKAAATAQQRAADSAIIVGEALRQPPSPDQCALTAREEAASSTLECDEATIMRSHAAAPNPMNHASPTLEWSPTTALCGRLLKAAASMSRLSLNAQSACGDDARKREKS